MNVDTLRAMSSLAQEVEETLRMLDPSTAAKFEQLVRDAVALVRPSGKTSTLESSYFDSVIGAFADIEFDRPAQGELPPGKPW